MREELVTNCLGVYMTALVEKDSGLGGHGSGFGAYKLRAKTVAFG